MSEPIIGAPLLKALAPTWCCAMLTLPSTTAMLPV